MNARLVLRSRLPCLFLCLPALPAAERLRPLASAPCSLLPQAALRCALASSMAAGPWAA